MDEILRLLPETPRAGMREWALKTLHDELCGEHLIFARESYVPDECGVGWPDFEDEIKPQWAARCTCTACGEGFWGGWTKGGGVSLVFRDDGQFYPGLPTEHDLEIGYGGVLVFPENDTMDCPFCGVHLRLTRRIRLRRPRTWAHMVASVENVGRCTAVLYWMVRRTLDSFGCWELDILPWAALVIGPSGGLHLYRHTMRGMCWERCGGVDPQQTRYFSADALNSTRVGAAVWPDVPDETGQSGEKTGLSAYVRAGGGWPYLYLKLWEKRRAVENLVKAGWTETIDSAISAEVDAALTCGWKVRLPRRLDELLNWTSPRPAGVLRMTRAAARMGSTWCWEYRALVLWFDLLDHGQLVPKDAAYFNRLLERYGTAALESYDRRILDGALYDVKEVDAYLTKQERRYQLPVAAGMQMLLDYRDMLDEVIEGEPTRDELWPRCLRAAHDAMAGVRTAKQSSALDSGFATICAKWGALEWSDGTICARLPRCNADLVDEGHVLNHCVGRYGRGHVEGNLIVFIRHARRPERSWYTLNIDVRGGSWRRVQLHGYGNEWGATGKHLHIPDAVTAFVARWEREVLDPAFRAVKAAEKPKKKGRGKKGRGRRRAA